jgi:hypothetical protein
MLTASIPQKIKTGGEVYEKNLPAWAFIPSV